MDRNDEDKVFSDEKLSDHTDHPEVSESFYGAWDRLIDHLSFRHSIESDMDVGTPPYEESRYFGWGDEGDELDDGYDEPESWLPDDCEYEDDYRGPDSMLNESDDEPEGEHDWQMEVCAHAIAGYEHLENLPRFEKMRRS
ncbi:hypothetical protein HYV70_05175 [Candidatus Uhrbacteria bacterium]|nr:hypothetical protein [Candidatus Uhrbacteria bacterium]